MIKSYWNFDTSRIIQADETRIISENSYEKVLKIPKSLGHGEAKLIEIRDGLFMGIMNQFHSVRMSMETEVPIDCIKFTFIYSGSFQTNTFVKVHPQFNISMMSNLVLRGESPKVIIEFAPNCQNTLVTVFVNFNLFTKLIDDFEIFLPDNYVKIIENSNYDQFVHSAGFTPSIQLLINEIFNIPEKHPLKKIYLESKALELIALRLEQLSLLKNNQKKTAHLNSQDIEKIHLAREILIKNMENPPSLIQLSRQIGLNDFKLKKGFKEIYNNTVFGFLREKRMEKARQLMATVEMNVTEIAMEVGYNAPSHFAAEFKKKYGLSPSEVLSEIKNKNTSI